jgi:hypothetical protein
MSMRPSAGGNPTQFVRHIPRLPAQRAFPEGPGLEIIMRLSDDNGEIIFVTIAAGPPLSLQLPIFLRPQRCDLRVNEYTP